MTGRPPAGPDGTPRRALVTGWFSFLHGEVTAGDVLALRRVEEVLTTAGVSYDTAWSPAFRPDGLALADADPARYSHLLFVCGPLYGRGVEELHRVFGTCVRVAVGVSVMDRHDPAVTGFHHVLPRDAPHSPAVPDLSRDASGGSPPPVVGVVFTHGQREYGDRRRHDTVADSVATWLADKDCARLHLDTRLASADWRLCATADQFLSAVARLDLVVTDRLHGLVLSLRAGVPVLAVDPVAGGAKVTAQARACEWPALLPADRLSAVELDRMWEWCLSSGTDLARLRREQFRRPAADDLGQRLLAVLGAAD